MMSTAAVASADIVRTMAHEIRQPLSTIESIAYYLTLILPPDDQKVHEQLNRIQQLVEQSNWIVTSAHHLTEPISLKREPIDLKHLIAHVIERFPQAPEPAPQVPDDLPPILADKMLIGALIETLFTLFRPLGSDAHPVHMRVRGEGAGAAIEFATAQPGYKSEASLGPGATLSLDSARRIIAAHDGSLDLRIDPAAGIRLRVMLP